MMTGPTSVSITSRRRRWFASLRLDHVVEGIAVLEPAAREDRSADEVRQPADLPQVASGRDVIVRAAQLAGCCTPRA